MLKYFTLRNKIDYSLSSFFNYMATNFWVFIGWVFSTYLLPIQSVVIVMLAMVTFDLVTGIWKSAKQKEKITSKRLGHTIEKTILYVIGMLSSFVLQTHLGVDIIKPLWLFTTLIITREYVSVIENIEAITGTRLVEIIKHQLSRILPDLKKEDEKKEP